MIGANAALASAPTFAGNILDAAGITLGHFANVTGRALAFGGTVTSDADTITVPTCGAIVSAIANTPTSSRWAILMLASLLAIVGFVVTRRSVK